MAATFKYCLLALFAAMAFAPLDADACIHVAEDADVDESSYSAIVMFADEIQRIYLRPGVELGSETAEIAWVIPTPTRPRDVALANVAFVDWVETELTIQELVRERSKRSRGKSLEVSEPFKVGPYEMQSVQATGKEGAEALSSWLEDNGFGTIEGPILDYYVENSWSFTTVKTDLRAGDDDEPEELLPIVIEFATPTPVIPTRLMAAKNEILVKVWYITDSELEESQFRHAHQAFGLEIAPDRRKGSDWDFASDKWILGRESVYTSQLASRKTVLSEIQEVYPAANRLWVYGLVGKVSPRRAKRAKQDLFIGEPGTKLDMADYEYEPPEPTDEAAPEGVETPDAGQPEAPSPEQPGAETPDFVKEIPEDSEMDLTMIMGIVALAFFVLVVLGVQFRKMR